MELSRVGKTLFRNISADIFIPSDIKKKERHLIALRLVFIGDGEGQGKGGGGGESLTYNDIILDTPLTMVNKNLHKYVHPATSPTYALHPYHLPTETSI